MSEEYHIFPNTPIVVPSNGSIHNDSGFCYDPTCPCHEDRELITDLNQHVVDGEASSTDADRIYHGKAVW
jgi:hypothetical protein